MSWLKKLLCWHEVWAEGPVIKLLTGARVYTCLDCGKQIERVHAPVNRVW